MVAGLKDRAVVAPLPAIEVGVVNEVNEEFSEEATESVTEQEENSEELSCEPEFAEIDELDNMEVTK